MECTSGEELWNQISGSGAEDQSSVEAHRTSTCEEGNRLDELDQAIAAAVRTLADGGELGVESTSEIATRNAEELNRLAELAGNGRCVECGKRPARWASYSIGIFLCIRCSGLHRGLGTHLSKVRSLDLDGSSFFFVVSNEKSRDLRAPRQRGKEREREHKGADISFYYIFG